MSFVQTNDKHFLDSHLDSRDPLIIHHHKVYDNQWRNKSTGPFGEFVKLFKKILLDSVKDAQRSKGVELPLRNDLFLLFP